MISDIAKQMLHIWTELTSIDDKSTGMNYSGHYDAKRLATATSALAYDPSGVSTAMMAEEFHKQHMAGRHFSLTDLLQPSDHIEWLISQTKQLSNLFDADETKAAFSGLRESISSGLKHYEVEINPDYQALLDNNSSLAALRVSAISSSKELQLDQFMRGEPDASGAKPAVMRQVFKWWNINSLLAAAVNMPCGVSLHLIGTPKVMENYFVFVIRNGGNLYILSDIEKQAHPLQSGMRRRPDRVMENRINKAWFPYELIDIAYDEEDERFFETASKARDLVAFQTEWRSLAPINALEPQVTVWLTMMFTLIIQRFWGENVQVEELSYTGEMLLKSETLLDKAERANLPVLANTGLQAQTITRDSISQEIAAEDEIGKTYELTHDWMEKRYGPKVSNEALNLTSVKGVTPALSLNTSGQVVVMDDSLEKDRTSVMVFGAHGYPTTRFAKASELEKDRKFLARATYADAINKMAKREHDQRESEIRRWFDEAVRANKDSLISYAGGDDIWILAEGKDCIGTVYNNRAACKSNGRGDNFHQFMRRVEVGGEHNFWGATELFSWDGSKHRCVVTGAKASYFVGFSPTNAIELAVVTGCDVSDLPDVLQHWNIRDTRTGNSILNRIDPVAWKVEDPWRKMNFNSVLALSKRGLAQLQKDVKLPNLTIAKPEDIKFSSSIIRI